MVSTTTDETRTLRFAAVGLDHAHAFGQIEGLLGQGCELVGLSSDDPNAAVAQAVRDAGPMRPGVTTGESAARSDHRPDRHRRRARPARRHRARGAARTARTWWPTSRAASPSTSSTRSSERSPRPAGSGRSPSPSASRFAAPSRPASWSGRAGSAGSSRPWAWAPTGRATAPTWPAAQGRPDWFYDRNRHRRHPHRHRQPPDRPVPLVHRLRHRRGRVQHGGQLHPSGFARHAGLRRGDAASRSTAHGYVRVDWYTPQGLPTWGDGRLVILGTEGYIELRKYVDIAGRPGRDHLFVVDGAGTEYVDCSDVALQLLPRPGARRHPPHRDRVPAAAHLRGDAAGHHRPAERDHDGIRPLSGGRRRPSPG